MTDPDPTTRRDDVVVGPLPPVEAGAVLARLEQAEAAGGAPLVDEAEHERLRRLAADPTHRDATWRPLLATRAGETMGYGAVVLPGEPDGEAVGDLAVLGGEPTGPIRAAVLADLEALAREHGAGHVQVWMRQVSPEQVDEVEALGMRMERRLGVLGRDLDALPSAGGAAATVRAYRPDVDAGAAVDVLASAYAGSDEAGWDLARLHERRRLPWFRPEDLLLGEVRGEDGEPWVGGLHWLKRRGPEVGEVYNLAIHPGAQGGGLGARLLRAGLEHLREVGCREVVLWVDLANERAVALYRSQGFETRWQDVAVGRTLTP